MALEGAWNAYIFREGKTLVRGSELVNGLANGLIAFDNASSETRRIALIDVFMRAGELEGALLDAGSIDGDKAAVITDALSDCVVASHPVRGKVLAQRTRSLCVPERMTVTPPEGFAYYSLHPLDFADLISRVHPASGHAAVIGIRSIGTTLSAVVSAALRSQHVIAERITVRPIGHPYDRHTEFTGEQRSWIAEMLLRGAEFFIVDEGPGMSGSSFLSVGDALLSAGVPISCITFLGTREPDPASLTAPNAVQRWPAYRSVSTRPTTHLPAGATEFVAGGIWRAHVYYDQQQWPASWLQMERLKFFSAPRDVVFKFEGFGRFGRAVHDRSRHVAEGGFGPMPLGFDEGFGAYPMLRGRPLNVSDSTPRVLQRLADYCAFRSQALQTSAPSNVDLATMLTFNVKEEFGIDLSAAASNLLVVHPVIADGRMLPHKWIDSGGAILKLDSAIHGDDHFFPGPTDIAWDLAGAIVEWELDPVSALHFLDCYYRASGDHAHDRIDNYLLAYCTFRTAYCKMASASMQGSEEEPRLIRDYHRYRSLASRCLSRGDRLSLPRIGLNEKTPVFRIA